MILLDFKQQKEYNQAIHIHTASKLTHSKVILLVLHVSILYYFISDNITLKRISSYVCKVMFVFNSFSAITQRVIPK